MYKVINRFKEISHDGHVYEVGDTYPAEGKKLVPARAEFLIKRHLEYGVAFLEEITEEAKVAPKKTQTKAKEKPAPAEKSDE